MIYLKNKNGFTLLEIIISMAIIGLLTVSFLEMFTFGFKGVFTAGQNSKTQYLAQQEIENKLANITSSTTQISPIILRFKSPVESDVVIVTIYGKIEKVTKINGNYQVDLATFLPN